jgi:CDP-glucose 4,6-dehydratase
LDCSKAHAKLDWQPRWNLATTLKSIVHWHKQWLAGDNMQTATLQQISHYQD